MKERPILFSSPMVRALLDGRKTQTRRVCKASIVSTSLEGVDDGVATFSRLYGDGPGYDVQEDVYQLRSPYGKPDDRLWVRETWAHHVQAIGAKRDEDGPFVYAADGELAKQYRLGDKWKPSIFMPRCASRILLEIIAVRVERLQDISYDDALTEGIRDCTKICPDEVNNITGETIHETARRLKWPQREYRFLWESLHGADSWDANPWVWVIEFKKIES